MTNSTLVRMTELKMGQVPEIIGDPGRIRTCDLQLRRLLLYPLSYGAVRVFSSWVLFGYSAASLTAPIYHGLAHACE